MRRLLTLLTLISSLAAPLDAQQNPAAPDPLASLDFLLGAWSAKTNTASSAGAQAIGNYSFHRDLAGHALTRTSSTDTCKGPQGFDCQHHDQLTIFAYPNALAMHHSSLLALYLDSEGHVIYYTITTPDPNTVVFVSQSAPGTPHFRLTYHLEGSGPAAVMTGKFQGAAPGSDDYHSYLEWSGTRQ